MTNMDVHDRLSLIRPFSDPEVSIFYGGLLCPAAKMELAVDEKCMPCGQAGACVHVHKASLVRCGGDEDKKIIG